MLNAVLEKPIFRQSQLIDGLCYAGLRKPGHYVPRGIRKNLHGYGSDLVTCDGKGEYCRVCLDVNGFITEITCITRKVSQRFFSFSFDRGFNEDLLQYNNLEMLYRLYGVHESSLNNMVIRCRMGEIENFLDYFTQKSFSVVLHDQFKVLQKGIRKKNMDCLEEFLRGKEKVGY